MWIFQKYTSSRSHTDIGFLFEIKEGKVDKLIRLIKKTRSSIFSALQLLPTLHFARILILPARHSSPNRLLICATSDDDRAALINSLIQIAELRDLLEFTTFTNGNLELNAYFEAHQMPPVRTFYAGNQAHSVKTIVQNKDLYEACLDYLHKLYNLERPTSVHRVLKLHFSKQLNEIDIASFSESSFRKFGERLRMLTSFINLIPIPVGKGFFYKFLLLLSLPFSSLKFLFGIKIPNYVLRHFEKKYTSESSTPVRDRNVLMYYEDRLQQNQFNFWGPVKKNTYWKYRLLLFLNLSDWFARYIYKDGKLTEVSTIHFARITTTDDDNQMLFMSEFDGSWELYLNDFVSIGKKAVLNAWNNLEGCPPTKDGDPTPGFANAFLPYIRNYQIESLVWYSAYPNLSVNQIKKHEKFIKILKGEPDTLISLKLVQLLS